MTKIRSVSELIDSGEMPREVPRLAQELAFAMRGVARTKGQRARTVDEIQSDLRSLGVDPDDVARTTEGSIERLVNAVFSEEGDDPVP